MTVPSRRSVMRKFGLYLDWLVWANEVKRGEEEPPEGHNFGDMIGMVKSLEDEYMIAVTHYVTREAPQEGGDA